MSTAHLAIDLGASSGRAILGILDSTSGSLSLEELHRFKHEACPTPVGPVWDLTGIWRNILQGLGKAASWCRDKKIELVSIGVDTWGVDWTLLGKSGEVLFLPHCYRDPQNDVACEKVLERLGGFEPLYERTGIQLMSLNTIFQYAARFEKEPQIFEAADRLVFLPDLFHYWLSGEIATERSIASTSSMLTVESNEWDRQLLEQLDLPHDVLGPIVDSGTELGTIRDEVASETGVSSSLRVVVPASHDTASAVAAVPADDSSNWAYLSSGTWSLLGAELEHPINSPAAREAPFTNERGVEGTVRFLKNIAGLWLIQELQRDLGRSGTELSFQELVDEARAVEPGRTLIDPNYAEFAAPGEIVKKLREFAQSSQQPEPKTAGQFARCCLDSLALCYADTLDQLESVTGRTVEVLHLVGGGIQNELLNELTASAIGKPVTVGPVEATAIGNILVQAMGGGKLSSLSEIRQVVKKSFQPETLITADNENSSRLRSRFECVVSSAK